MRIFLRLTLLGTFAAVGIAVAVGVALHTEPDKQSSQAAPFLSETADAQLQASVPVSADRATEALSASDPSAPQLAGYQEVVADRIERMEQSIQNVQQSAWQDQAERQRQWRQIENSMGRIEEEAKRRRIEDIESTLSQVQIASNQQTQLLTDALSAIHVNEKSRPVEQVAQLPYESGAARIDIVEQPTPNLHGGVGGGEDAPIFLKSEGDGMLTINTKDTDIREVIQWLSEQGDFNILASASVKGAVSASLTNVDVHSALEAILNSTGFLARSEGDFIYIGTREDLRKMDFLHDKIVRRIYRTNYVTAIELRTLIEPLLTKGNDIGLAIVSSPAEVDIGADTSHTGGDNFAGSEVLLVQDYESVLAQIDQLVSEVDRQPLQVSIEAMIISVTLDDSDIFGVNFEALLDDSNVRLVTGSPLANLAAIDISQGGLNFGFLDSSVTAFVNALETVGDTNVIASPTLMCLNKQRAEILIGQQRGYLTTTQTETATTQTVEFLEVGTQLRIRPFISEDGMIRMEIHPELSTGDVRLVGDFALPDKEVTQVTTNVMCRDGSTIVIGGLIREENGSTASQIPLLGNIPIVGALFRNKTETIDRSEIIVLITPRIVGEPDMDFRGKQVAAEYNHRISVYADKMSPIGKRYYGRRYYRLAQSAWMAGNIRAARRHINLAVHYDPLNGEAIALQSEIAGTDVDGFEMLMTPDSFPPPMFIEEIPEGETAEAPSPTETDTNDGASFNGASNP